jgi:hypothetical protein
MTNERCPIGADMTTRVPEIVSADRIIVTITGNAMPPRDPNDDDDDDDDDDDEEDEDFESNDDVEPAVVREPDE